MYDELRERAKKKVEAKMAFYICAIVFGFVTLVLLMLSSYLPSVAFWLRLPIPIFIMVLAILYLAAFGLPTTGKFSDDWQENEIKKEMIRLYRQRKAELPPPEEMSEEDILKLQELELLDEQLIRDEDFV